MAGFKPFLLLCIVLLVQLAVQGAIHPYGSNTSTLTPTITPAETPSGSRTPTVTPTPTPSSTFSSTPSLVATPSASGTLTPSLSRSGSGSGTFSQSPTLSLSASRSTSYTPTLSTTPTLSVTASITVTASVSATRSKSLSATDTAALTTSVTATTTVSKTKSATVSESATVSQSATQSESETFTESIYNVALPGDWRLLSQTVDAVQRAAGVCVGSSLFVFGGRNRIGRVISTMFEFGAALGWREVSYTGEIMALYGHEMVAVGSDYYLFGGTRSDAVISDQLWKFDSTRSRWSIVTPASLERPEGRSWYQMVYVPPRNSFIVLFGRTNKLLDPDVWEFNVTSLTWKLMQISPTDPPASLTPEPRYDTCCEYHGPTGRIYCYGGRTADGDTREMWILSFGPGSVATASSPQWIAVDPPQSGSADPGARRSMQCAMVNDHLLVTGGRLTEEGYTVPNDDMHVFDPTTQVWARFTQDRNGGVASRVRNGTATASLALSLSVTVSQELTRSASGSRSRSRSHTVPPQSTRTLTLTTIHDPNATANATLPPTNAPGGSTPDAQSPPAAALIVEREIPILGVPRERGIMCTSTTGTTYILGGVRNTAYLNDLRSLGSNYQWSVVTEAKPFPGKRADHVSFVVATSIFVAFGRDALGVLDDVWTFSTQVEQWSLRRPLNIPRGRYGSSVATAGALVYIFGGLLSTTDPNSFTSQLWQYDTGIDVFKEIVPESRPTPPRAFHASMQVSGDILVLFGSTSATDYASDAWVFSSLRGDWFEVTITGTRPERRRRFVLIADGLSNFLLGGESTRTLSDKFEFGRPQYNREADKFFLEFREAAEEYPGDANRRVFARSGALAAGFGNRTLVCGGLISGASPPRRRDSCYQYERGATGLSSIMLPGPAVVAYGTAVYFQKSIYMFGGVLAENSIVQETGFTNGLQIWTFRDNAMCEYIGNGSFLQDVSCMNCAAGSTNPSCILTQPGKFSRFPFAEPADCEPGTFMPANFLGTQSDDYCQFCPEGTRNDKYGQTSCLPCTENQRCPVGSSIASNSTDATDLNIRDEIPDVFDSLTVPNPIWIAFGTFGGGLIIFVILIHVYRKRTMEKQVKWFLLPKHNELLKQLYSDFYVTGTGLRECDVFNILSDPRLPSLKPLTPLMVGELFRKHDDDGSMSISYSEFRMMLFDLIDDGFIPPFPGSKRDLIGPLENRAIKIFKKFSFKNIDKYYAQHRVGEMGDNLRLQRNSNGGIITVVFYVTCMVAVVALVVSFTYDNMIETRSSMPNTLISGNFDTDFELEFNIEGSNLPEVCVEPTTGACRTGTVVTPTGFYISSQAQSCAFLEGGICQIRWECNDCEMIDTNAQIQLQVTDERAFANRIDIELKSFTGITELDTPSSKPDKQHAYASWTIEAPLGRMFKGFPGSQVTTRATQTKFQAPRSSWDQGILTLRGYHVQAVESQTVGGQTVTPTDFSYLFGVPVTVNLEKAPSTLEVIRTSRQGLLQLATGVLGALSGISGALLTLLVFIDRRSNKKKKVDVEIGKVDPNQFGDMSATPGTSLAIPPNDEDEEEIDDDAVLGDGNLDEALPAMRDLQVCQEDRDLVIEVIKHDVNIFAAVEIVTMIKDLIYESEERMRGMMGRKIVVASGSNSVTSPTTPSSHRRSSGAIDAAASMKFRRTASRFASLFGGLQAERVKSVLSLDDGTEEADPSLRRDGENGMASSQQKSPRLKGKGSNVTFDISLKTDVLSEGSSQRGLDVDESDVAGGDLSINSEKGEIRLAMKENQLMATDEAGDDSSASMIAVGPAASNLPPSATFNGGLSASSIASPALNLPPDPPHVDDGDVEEVPLDSSRDTDSGPFSKTPATNPLQGAPPAEDPPSA